MQSSPCPRLSPVGRLLYEQPGLRLVESDGRYLLVTAGRVVSLSREQARALAAALGQGRVGPSEVK